jgi:hypothetical protein
MRYAILIYADEAAYAQLPPEELQASFTAFMDYNLELASSGVLLAGAELQPSMTASTLRMNNGAVQVTDGPYAETREQLLGFYTIDVPDHETAISWASRCPAIYGGSIELRPLGVTPDDPQA